MNFGFRACLFFLLQKWKVIFCSFYVRNLKTIVYLPYSSLHLKMKNLKLFSQMNLFTSFDIRNPCPKLFSILLNQPVYVVFICIKGVCGEHREWTVNIPCLIIFIRINESYSLCHFSWFNLSRILRESLQLKDKFLWYTLYDF